MKKKRLMTLLLIIAIMEMNVIGCSDTKSMLSNGKNAEHTAASKQQSTGEAYKDLENKDSVELSLMKTAAEYFKSHGTIVDMIPPYGNPDRKNKNLVIGIIEIKKNVATIGIGEYESEYIALYEFKQDATGKWEYVRELEEENDQESPALSEATVDKSATQIAKPVSSQNISDKSSIEIPSGAEVKWTKHTSEWDVVVYEDSFQVFLVVKTSEGLIYREQVLMDGVKDVSCFDCNKDGKTECIITGGAGSGGFSCISIYTIEKAGITEVELNGTYIFEKDTIIIKDINNDGIYEIMAEGHPENCLYWNGSEYI